MTTQHGERLRQREIVRRIPALLAYAENLIEPSVWRLLAIVAALVCVGFGLWLSAIVAMLAAILAQLMCMEGER